MILDDSSYLLDSNGMMGADGNFEPDAELKNGSRCFISSRGSEQVHSFSSQKNVFKSSCAFENYVNGLKAMKYKNENVHTR